MEVKMYDLANAHKRLALLRELANANVLEACKAIGCSPEDIEEWERHGLPLDKSLWCHIIVERASARYHCSLKWLREGIGEAPKEAVLAKTVTIDAECGPCHGSGVYPGQDVGPSGEIPAEHKVVCRSCHGLGKYTIEYGPFVKRYPRTDVERVHTNHLADHRGSVSYERFLQGARP